MGLGFWRISRLGIQSWDIIPSFKRAVHLFATAPFKLLFAVARWTNEERFQETKEGRASHMYSYMSNHVLYTCWHIFHFFSLRIKNSFGSYLDTSHYLDCWWCFYFIRAKQGNVLEGWKAVRFLMLGSEWFLYFQRPDNCIRDTVTG